MMHEQDTPILGIERDWHHLNRQVAPLAHTAMYNWHKFWSRKTWNVVGEFIKNYCPEGGIVFDPFAGSGVTAMEALKNKRRAIVCDLLPIATEIIRLTIKNVDTNELREAFYRVEKKSKNKILSLYITRCRKCHAEFPFTCAIWNRGKYEEIRYQKCPRCGDRREKNCPPNNEDEKLLKKIEESNIKEWYPRNKLYYPDGMPFKEKQKYESLDELFTKRNLQALAWLMEAIEEEESKKIRDFLRIAFSSMVHLCTKMMPVRPTRPFSSVWNEHSYWFAPEFMEQNVWEKFESAVIDRQGLIRAKEESNNFYSDIKFARDYHQLVSKEADIFIYNGSCFDLMKEMYKDFGTSGCVDYIFTDPPYDASVQYGELAYLWVSWLKMDEGYLEKIRSDEVVRNEKQQKTFDIYHSMLSRSFRDMYNMLKPNRYLTVTFHNPTFKVRNATIYAGIFAGFDFQQIHHQELARPSAKSLLQPYGSAQGDFYLRFYKQDKKGILAKPEQIDEARFDKIVTETTIKVLAERGEPTPYTIIINAIDPELAKNGFFSELNTGLDVKQVLQKHLDKDFILVPTYIGAEKGTLWWFKVPSLIPHLQTVPLSERVEQTVLRKLQQMVKVTFTDMWNAVSMEFPNSLTSDSMSIKDALQAYAREAKEGCWIIKSNLLEESITTEHTKMIAIIAEIGTAFNFDIWIGRLEQNHKITEPLFILKKTGLLKQYVTLADLSKLTNIENSNIVEDMDILWMKKDKVICAFEIESTTSMTSALQRGSNIDNSVSKYLVIPEDRDKQLERKLKSPMFGGRFKDDHWNVLFFNTLEVEFTRRRNKVDQIELQKIAGKKTTKGIDVADRVSDHPTLW